MRGFPAGKVRVALRSAARRRQRRYGPIICNLSERREPEEFTVDACYLMRDRFVGTEIWRTLDFDPDECIRYASEW